MTGKNKKWEQWIEDRVLEEVDINAGFGKSDPEQYYGTYNFYPRRTVDESMLIVGSGISAAIQLSLLNAMASYWGFDWAQWKEQFENGFDEWKGFYKEGLYKDKSKPWGKDPKRRPLIKEIKSDKKYDYKLVEFFPDRSQPKRSYLFSGTYQEISLQIRQFWTLEQFIGEKSIGEFVAYPITQWLRQSPILSPRISLHLVAGRKWEGESIYPKYEGIGKKYTIWPSQCTIFQPDFRKLKYNSLRTAMGGDFGLDWGNYTARAYLSPKSRNQNPETRDGEPDSRHKSNSQMVARGSSPKSARDNLDRILKLSKATVVSEPREGYEPPEKNDPRPERYRVYPGWISVEPPSKKILKKAFGADDYEKFVSSIEKKFWIDDPKKPEDWDKRLKATLNITYGV